MTDAQLKAINSDANSILVSAAAGAGKTSVLANRVIRHIKEKNAELSELLVVTFTEAASIEMKERIAKELGKIGEPAGLVSNSDISTIHAFCRKLVKENYWKLDIDPAFRVGDDAELGEMTRKVMQELFEEEYESGSTGFLDLVEVYGGKMSDVRLDELVRRLHFFLESDPYPEAAAKRYADFFRKSEDEILSDESVWVRLLRAELQSSIEGAIECIDRAILICQKERGPFKYIEALQSDSEMLLDLLHSINENPLVELYDEISNITWDRLARITAKDDVDENLKEQVRRIRDNSIKKRITNAVSGVFFAPPHKMAEDIIKVAPRVMALLDLVKGFGSRYAMEKRAENILDFSDLEHYAIRILYPDGPGNMKPDETYRTFYEVLVDEYQDSNEMQDLILSAVAKRKFMVGDAKQSIYRFRRADPDMFVGMFKTFKHGSMEKERIDLSDNFRSRPEVIRAVNFFFSKICSREVGGVEYDENARLNPGHKGYPGQVLSMQVEIFDESDEEEEEVDEDIDVVIAETRMIASCIHEILATKKVGRLSDIAILTRGLSSIAGDVLTELAACGIPAVAESNVSFFAATEIKTMRALLRVVDNPRQDIELIAALKSPMFDFSLEELYEISRAGEGLEKMDFYDKLVLFSGSNTKAEKFLRCLESMRQASIFMPVSRLISHIYDLTSYPAYAVTGAQAANFRLLTQVAVQFGETGRSGLFQFNLYLDKLDAAGKLSSSAETAPGGDYVRLMTIHKSKGLEFPVVFVSFLAKQFNVADLRSSVILHPKYGIGPYFVDTTLRTRANTLARFSLSKLTHYQNLSEEMRCLYVAMTRAEDLLVLTGRVKDLKKSMQKWKDGVAAMPGGVVPAYYLKSAKCFLDWLMPCLITDGQEAVGFDHPAGFKVRFHTKNSSESGHEGYVTSTEKNPPPEYIEPYAKTSFAYPSKLSISEIKRLYDISPDSTVVTGEMRLSFELPAFYQQQKKLSFAEIGQAVHVILEHIDYYAHTTLEKMVELVIRLSEENYASKEALKAVDISRILHFVNSALGDRIRAAKQVYRETPFVLNVPSSRLPLGKGGETDEKILVHGIIDCYFVEDGKIVLVDFKNDRIPDNMKPDDWAKTHAVQLGIYKEALEKSIDVEVAEVLLYSFHLGREVALAIS